MVADSALYQYENLQLLTNIKWFCRVPFRIKSATKLVENIDSSSWIRSRIQGYRYQEVKKTYGGVLQRWLVIESQKRLESDLKHLEKKIKNEEVAVQKKLRELTSQKFACIPDAQKAPKQLFPKYLYDQITGINIKQIGDNKSGDSWDQVQGKITVITEKIELDKKRAGKFILATNVLDTAALTTE